MILHILLSLSYIGGYPFYSPLLLRSVQAAGGRFYCKGAKREIFGSKLHSEGGRLAGVMGVG
jgi:hypothetical protein